MPEQYAPRILVFSGSIRKASFNTRLARVVTDSLKHCGSEPTLLSLADYPMPLYNGDLEDAEGLPEAAKAFKQQMIDHDGFVICSPEYNSAFSPLLKNALDWASRTEPEESSTLRAFRGKHAALLAASPGALGGLRGLVHLRMVLGNLGVHVLPDQLAVSKAGDAFDEDGALKEPGQRKRVDGVCQALSDLMKATLA